MSVYLIATLEVRAGAFAQFTQGMGEMIPILEGAGWKLSGAFVTRVGLLNTVVDIWEIDDFNHVNLGMAAVAQSPGFPQIQRLLQESVARETLCLADRLVFPGRGTSGKIIRGGIASDDLALDSKE